MLKEEKYKQKLSSLLKRQTKFDFSEFLCHLRNITGTQREFVSHDIGLPSSRLAKLEKGEFIKPVKTWELKLVADYYGVEYELLKDKHKEFIDNRKVG